MVSALGSIISGLKIHPQEAKMVHVSSSVCIKPGCMHEEMRTEQIFAFVILSLIYLYKKVLKNNAVLFS